MWTFVRQIVAPRSILRIWVEILLLFCGELSKSLFEYRSGWEAHRTGIGVEVDDVLSVPLGAVLELPTAVPNNVIARSVSAPVLAPPAQRALLWVHLCQREAAHAGDPDTVLAALRAMCRC